MGGPRRRPMSALQRARISDSLRRGDSVDHPDIRPKQLRSTASRSILALIPHGAVEAALFGGRR